MNIDSTINASAKSAIWYIPFEKLETKGKKVTDKAPTPPTINNESSNPSRICTVEVNRTREYRLDRAKITSYFLTTTNKMKKTSDEAPEMIRTCIFDNPGDSSPPCAEAICAKENENKNARINIQWRISERNNFP